MAIAVLAVVAMGTARAAADDGGHQKGAPRFVVVLIDDQTEEFGTSHKSRHDGLPILGPQVPPKRIHELLARAQRALNAAHPLAVIWDCYFTPPGTTIDPPSTAELLRQYRAARYPLVLGTDVLETALNPLFYAERPSLLEGHVLHFVDAEKRAFSPIFIPPCLGRVPTQFSLAISAAAAAMMALDKLSKYRALAEAQRVAFYLAQKAPDFETPSGKTSCVPNPPIVPGFRLEPRPLEHISMKDLLVGEPRALARLAGAVVFVGGVTGDSDDILGDGKQQPKVLIHAWSAENILSTYLSKAHLPPAN